MLYYKKIKEFKFFGKNVTAILTKFVFVKHTIKLYTSYRLVQCWYIHFIDMCSVVI